MLASSGLAIGKTRHHHRLLHDVIAVCVSVFCIFPWAVQQDAAGVQQPYGVCVKAGARLNAVSRRVPAVPWQNENQCVCVRVCARHIISTKWSGTSSSSSSSSLLGSARRRGPSCTQRSNPERISGLQSIKRTRPPPGVEEGVWPVHRRSVRV